MGCASSDPSYPQSIAKDSSKIARNVFEDIFQEQEKRNRLLSLIDRMEQITYDPNQDFDSLYTRLEKRCYYFKAPWYALLSRMEAYQAE